MRSSRIAGIAGIALLSSSLAGLAATLIPVVPVTGSTSTGAFGINDSNTLTGSWIDSGGIEHGFFGSLSGSYTTFDYTGNTAKGTEPRNIDDKSLIVGYGPTDGTGSYVLGPQFAYDTLTAMMTTITEAGVPLDGIAQGLSKTGTFAGDHWVLSGSSYTRYGYLGKNGKWQQDLSVFGSNAVAARGVNKAGVVVGFFLGSDGNDHGFIQQGGTTTQVDFPDPTVQDTFLEGINDKGQVTGQWYNNSGTDTPMAFVLNVSTNTFTSIAISGSTYQAAWGINEAGLIALTSDVGSFIYCPKKPSKCPAGGAEVADGRSIVAQGLSRNAIHATATHAAPRSPVPGGPALP